MPWIAIGIDELIRVRRAPTAPGWEPAGGIGYAATASDALDRHRQQLEDAAGGALDRYRQ
jgi:hypothetical protein